jgi:hypothetical protein
VVGREQTTLARLHLCNRVMSSDDGLRRRNTNHDDSNEPDRDPLNLPSTPNSTGPDELSAEPIESASQPILRVRQMRMIELINEMFLHFRMLWVALNHSVGTRMRLAFGPNLIQIATVPNAVPGFEFGVAFEANPVWNEREVPEEFVNPNPSQIHNVRQRMFRTIFTKIVLLCVLTLPPRLRKVFEYSLLLSAFACLFTLTYLHVVFVRRPRNCLEHVPVNWTTDGILRLEVLSKAEQHVKYGDSLIALQHLSLKPDPIVPLLTELEQIAIMSTNQTLFNQTLFKVLDTNHTNLNTMNHTRPEHESDLNKMAELDANSKICKSFTLLTKLS